MIEIPEDIRAKATEVAAALYNYSGGAFATEEEMFECIARALMEERERCARIAEEEDDCGPDTMAVREIVRAIRSPIQNEDKT